MAAGRQSLRLDVRGALRGQRSIASAGALARRNPRAHHRGRGLQGGSRGGQIGGIGLQKVAIDTLQLLCVVGVIETLGTVSWRMAPTSDTRKISGASDSDQKSLVEALLEGMGEGFFAFDRNWRLTASNSAAEAIFGAPSAEIVGDLFGTSCPRSGGQNSTDVVALSWRSAREKNSRSIRRCASIAITRCELFLLALTLGWRFATSRIAERDTQALRGRELELARVQRIGGVGGLDVDLSNGFRSQRSPEYLHLHGLPAKRRQRHARAVGRARSPGRQRAG